MCLLNCFFFARFFFLSATLPCMKYFLLFPHPPPHQFSDCPPLRLFSLERSTVKAFAVPLRVFRQKNSSMTGNHVLFRNCYLLEVKKISSHTHKTGSWYLLEDLFKMSLLYDILRPLTQRKRLLAGNAKYNHYGIRYLAFALVLA